MIATPFRLLGHRAASGAAPLWVEVMPVGEQTPARRAVVAASKARKKAAGVDQVNVRLAADVRDKLDALAERYGSKDAPVAAAIEALAVSS